MPHADLAVRVTPRSSRNKVEVGEAGVKVWVTASPTDGQANDAVCAIIAKAVHLPPSSVSVVRGLTSREKLLRLEGIELEEVHHRLTSH